MKRLQLLSLVFGLAFASVDLVSAQTADDKAGASPTRAQVKMERNEFLRTHRWDEPTETWVLKSGVEPPTGVRSRAEVMAERDKFLSNNRWDDPNGVWVPLKATPRDMSTLSKAQVRAEAKQFARTHRWDEQTGTWIEKAPRAKTQ